jgi:hypothetical protein
MGVPAYVVQHFGSAMNDIGMARYPELTTTSKA